VCVSVCVCVCVCVMDVTRSHGTRSDVSRENVTIPSQNILQ